MATTLDDLVYDVQSYLYAFGREQDKETFLTADCQINDLSFVVDEPLQVDRGIVEIDGEQLRVKGRDSSGTISLMPYGRGLNNTTAALHTAGTKVTSNPRWPRAQIVNELNRVLQDIFPDLFSVKYTTLTWQPALQAYSLPADCYSIISVSYKTLGPSGVWLPIVKYRYDAQAYTGQFSSGRSLDIIQGAAPGQLVKVVYRSDFTPFVNGTDNMTSAGLQEGWRDIMTLGVQARMASTLDMERLQLGSVESADRAQYNQPTMASQVAKSLMQSYTQRLAGEKMRLQQLYPGYVTRMS